MLELNIKNYKVCIYGENRKEKVDIFYLPVLSNEQSKDVWNLVQDKCVLVTIHIEKWNDDLSPWYAEKIFKQGENFFGKGKEFLNILNTNIVPEVEKILNFEVNRKNRGICGYSMAGMFAIYAFLESPFYSKVGSMSGSLWYDQFEKYVLEKEIGKELEIEKAERTDKIEIKEEVTERKDTNENRIEDIYQSWINRQNNKFYFSLGDKESETKNSRMKKVKECTENIKSYFSEKYDKVEYVVNEGGHFNECNERIAKGILRLIEM